MPVIASERSSSSSSRASAQAAPLSRASAPAARHRGGTISRPPHFFDRRNLVNVFGLWPMLRARFKDDLQPVLATRVSVESSSRATNYATGFLRAKEFDFLRGLSLESSSSSGDDACHQLPSSEVDLVQIIGLWPMMRTYFNGAFQQLSRRVSVGSSSSSGDDAFHQISSSEGIRCRSSGSSQAILARSLA